MYVDNTDEQNPAAVDSDEWRVIYIKQLWE